MDIFTEQILTKTIQIKYKDITKNRNIDGIIQNELKKNEGKSTKEGYILKDSIEIIQRSIGKMLTINKESLIQYKVTYKIKSILPKIGDKYDCYIQNITKMGLLCFVKIENIEDITNSPLLIIIPKEYCKIDKYKGGDKINSTIIDFRIKYMSPQIQLIGKIED